MALAVPLLVFSNKNTTKMFNQRPDISGNEAIGLDTTVAGVKMPETLQHSQSGLRQDPGYERAQMLRKRVKKRGEKRETRLLELVGRTKLWISIRKAWT